MDWRDEQKPCHEHPERQNRGRSAGQQHRQQVYQRDHQRARRDGQSQVVFPRGGCTLLPLLLRYVEVAQPDQSRQHEKAQCRVEPHRRQDPPDGPAEREISGACGVGSAADHRRQHAEADQIVERSRCASMSFPSVTTPTTFIALCSSLELSTLYHFLSSDSYCVG